MGGSHRVAIEEEYLKPDSSGEGLRGSRSSESWSVATGCGVRRLGTLHVVGSCAAARACGLGGVLGTCVTLSACEGVCDHWAVRAPGLLWSVGCVTWVVVVDRGVGVEGCDGASGDGSGAGDSSGDRCGKQ